MSEAILNLVTRETVELHFEGSTYGPVEHTQPLGVLLLCLAPATVRCIGNGPRFEAAMSQLLSAAERTCEQLQDVDGGDPFGGTGDVEAGDLERWVSAALSAVPREKEQEFLRRLAGCLGRRPSPVSLH